MLRKFDHLAIEAKKDRKVLEQLLQQNERFIVKCAYSVTHKYLQKSDDEWSIAMFGFTQAVEGYQLDKGSFYSFADLVIRRKLIDFYREQRKYDAEVLVNPIVFDTEQDSDDDNSAVLNAVAKQLVKEEDTSVKLEIEAIHGVLSNYGFSFFDLVDCSPKTAKTKACDCVKCLLAIPHSVFQSTIFSLFLNIEIEFHRCTGKGLVYPIFACNQRNFTSFLWVSQ